MGKARFPFILALLLLLPNLAGCSSDGGSAQSGDGGGGQNPEYNKTKSMTLDILHSKEGKDTLKDILKDPAFRRSVAVNDTDVSTALVKIMSDEKNQKQFIDTQIKDPKFAASMVKASKKEHEQLLKTLMKDPEYQRMMLSVMKSPEYQNMAVSLMESPEYRQYTLKVLADSLQNPEFRLVFMDIVKEAIRSGAGVSQTTEQGKGKAQGQDKKGQGQDKAGKQGDKQGGEEGGDKQGGGKEAGGGDSESQDQES